MSLTHKTLITSLTSEGEGIGSLDGLKIFVDNALIGEEVLLKIKEKKSNYATGTLLEIITPSPDRVEAPCPYFGQCGGCQLMHLSYQKQLIYKRQRVIDAFKKIAKLDVHVEECLPSPDKLAYRNKVQLPLIWDHQKKKIGFFKKRSHEIIPIDYCLIQTLLGNKLLDYFQKTLSLSFVRYILIKTSKDHQQAQITFVTGKTEKEDKVLLLYTQELLKNFPEVKGVIQNTNQREDSVILTNKERLLAGEKFITETLLNKRFKIASTSFFQVNPYQAEKLFEKALELAELTKEEIVVDAYCGVGTLAILAADYAKKVIGIEISKQAIEMAKENALLNGVNNCTFYDGLAEKKLQLFPKIDALFINPPRKGCEASFLSKVKEILPKKIIYISCNPATLARDLSLLPEYQVINLIPFDMFPQTTHVETLAFLVKKNSNN